MSDAEREAEIRARCERATPGPWDEDGYCRVLADPEILCDDIAYVPAWGGDTARPSHSDNMVFIAHSRADVPWLLARLDAERERADRAERELATVLEAVERQAYVPIGDVLVCRWCHARDSGLYPRGRDVYSVQHKAGCVLAASSTGAGGAGEHGD